jgi:hypothetical protein
VTREVAHALAQALFALGTVSEQIRSASVLKCTL